MQNENYVKHQEEYDRLVQELMAKYPEAVLSPEYCDIIQNNQLGLLIRLSRYKFVCRMLKKDDRVLDVGCSTGLGTIFIGQFCHSVLGLDVKDDDIDRAKKLNMRDNVEFKNIDLFDLEPIQKFSAVVNLDVIEHMNEEKGVRFTEKCCRMLEKDGLYIVGTPSYYIKEYQNRFSKAAHVKMYKQEELDELVGKFFKRTLCFSMNDEIVHTGHPKAAWYYFVIGFGPRVN